MNTMTPEQIRRAAAALRTQRPAYEALLRCYEEIFVAQEEHGASLDFAVPGASETPLAVKKQSALPLIDSADFTYDPEAAAELLIRICRILEATNPQLAEDAGRIAAGCGAQFRPRDLFAALLGENDVYFDETAHAVGVESRVLSFAAYCSLRPALSYCAGHLSGLRAEWEKGCCPICGHLPGIAVLDENGRRTLHCSFCWHPWAFPRSACPFCETRRPGAGKYLYSDAEKELRADLCESCDRYIKAVDTREARRPVYPPLEQVASLHLDLLARKHGYRSGARLPLQE